MPPASAKQAAPLILVCGDDDFAVKQRARKLFQDWSAELGGMDHETLEASVSNSGEALQVISRLREALNTLPFFGGGKVVWLRDCNFLGEERAAQTQAVTEALAELSDELKRFVWQNVRLIISAAKVDKRKTFYKTIDKLGSVESFDGWSINDRDWTDKAHEAARKGFKERGKTISEDAVSELVVRVGPNPRQLDNEVEKLCVYVGARAQITEEDVTFVSIRNKTAHAFALGDALGERDLPTLLRRLDEELWTMQFDKDKSEVGLLYGLISKVRALLLLKEMLREGWVKATGDYSSFKAQLERIPREKLPADKRFNPLAINPYVLYKALPQARNYTEQELVRAMDILLRCNQRLVTSALDDSLVLQHALMQIVDGPRPARSQARYG